MSETKPAISHNTFIAVKPDEMYTWLLATRDGWWPVDQVDQETLEYLVTFANDDRLPPAFRKFVLELNRKSIDREWRKRHYKNVPLLHGVNLKRLT